MSPDDTQPSPSAPPSSEDGAVREERAKVAYAAYSKSMAEDGFLEYPWEKIDDIRREAWRCAADAAYLSVVVSSA